MPISSAATEPAVPPIPKFAGVIFLSTPPSSTRTKSAAASSVVVVAESLLAVVIIVPVTFGRDIVLSAVASTDVNVVS